MTPRARGFTLIEMMIAIFIALIIFTIGFTAISSTIQARREAEARIHATENARLFFDMLQKDMATAYPVDSTNVNLPTMVVETPGQPITVNKQNMTVTNDRIEFFTHSDHRGLTDQYVFVRYFVNSLGHLCRQTNQAATPDLAFVPFTQTDDASALFDQAFAILVSPGQWQESSKTMAVSPAPPCTTTTTHLQVTLYMFGYNGATLATDNQAQTKRVFNKSIPVPDVFRPVP
jgi:prepilin-type N-terminal cleavage/methylation domain-containing protein